MKRLQPFATQIHLELMSEEFTSLLAGTMTPALGMQLKDSVLHAYTCVSLSFPALYSGFIVATSKLQKIMRVRKKELDWCKKRRKRAKMQPLAHEVGSELDDYEREEH